MHRCKPQVTELSRFPLGEIVTPELRTRLDKFKTRALRTTKICLLMKLKPWKTHNRYTRRVLTLNHLNRMRIYRQLRTICSTKTLTEKLDEESLERLHEALPRLLQTFAIKVGSSDTMQIHRDVMVFVRKHRRSVDITFATIINPLPDTM